MQREHRKFQANLVECHTEDWGNSHLVHRIYFAEGSEEGAESWNFTRSTEDDEGVCTVKEIQELTFYEGIKSFILSRQKASCYFTNTKPRLLEFTYDISEETWIRLKEQAKRVFVEKEYFSIEEASK